MIIWIIGSTLHFEIISLIPRLGVPSRYKNPMLVDTYLTQILKLDVEYPNYFQNNA